MRIKYQPTVPNFLDSSLNTPIEIPLTVNTDNVNETFCKCYRIGKLVSISEKSGMAKLYFIPFTKTSN